MASILVTIQDSSVQTDNGLVLPVAKLPETLTSIVKVSELYKAVADTKPTREGIGGLLPDQVEFLRFVVTLPVQYYEGSLVENVAKYYKRTQSTKSDAMSLSRAVTLLDDLVVILVSEREKGSCARMLSERKPLIESVNRQVKLLPLVDTLIDLCNRFTNMAPEEYDKLESVAYSECKSKGQGKLWTLFWSLVEQVNLLKSKDSPKTFTKKDYKILNSRLLFLREMLNSMLTLPK